MGDLKYPLGRGREGGGPAEIADIKNILLSYVHHLKAGSSKSTSKSSSSSKKLGKRGKNTHDPALNFETHEVPDLLFSCHSSCVQIFSVRNSFAHVHTILASASVPGCSVDSYLGSYGKTRVLALGGVGGRNPGVGGGGIPGPSGASGGAGGDAGAATMNKRGIGKFNCCCVLQRSIDVNAASSGVVSFKSLGSDLALLDDFFGIRHTYYTSEDDDVLDDPHGLLGGEMVEMANFLTRHVVHASLDRILTSEFILCTTDALVVYDFRQLLKFNELVFNSPTFSQCLDRAEYESAVTLPCAAEEASEQRSNLAFPSVAAAAMRLVILVALARQRHKDKKDTSSLETPQPPPPPHPSETQQQPQEADARKKDAKTESSTIFGNINATAPQSHRIGAQGGTANAIIKTIPEPSSETNLLLTQEEIIAKWVSRQPLNSEGGHGTANPSLAASLAPSRSASRKNSGNDIQINREELFGHNKLKTDNYVDGSSSVGGGVGKSKAGTVAGGLLSSGESATGLMSHLVSATVQYMKEEFFAERERRERETQGDDEKGRRCGLPTYFYGLLPAELGFFSEMSAASPIWPSRRGFPKEAPLVTVRQIRTCLNFGAPKTCELSPNQLWLLVGHESGAICVWQTSDFSMQRVLNGHTNMVTSLCFYTQLLVNTQLPSGGGNCGGGNTTLKHSVMQTPNLQGLGGGLQDVDCFENDVDMDSTPSALIGRGASTSPCRNALRRRKSERKSARSASTPTIVSDAATAQHGSSANNDPYNISDNTNPYMLPWWEGGGKNSRSDSATGELVINAKAGYGIAGRKKQLVQKCFLISTSQDATLRVWDLGETNFVVSADVDLRSIGNTASSSSTKYLGKFNNNNRGNPSPSSNRNRCFTSSAGSGNSMPAQGPFSGACAGLLRYEVLPQGMSIENAGSFGCGICNNVGCGAPHDFSTFLTHVDRNENENFVSQGGGADHGYEYQLCD